MDRRPEGIQTEAEGGTGRNDLIQSPIQPFLNKPRYGYGRLAILLLARREGKRNAQQIGLAMSPFQIQAQ